MRHTVLRSVLITVLAAIASLGIAYLVVPMLGGGVGPITIAMCLLCPAIVAFPISLYTERQRLLLRQANADLRRAHEELAAAHGALSAMHAQLAEKARHDDMTGMLNREAFFDTLRRARREGRPGTLLIVDADDFKQINDRHGHPTGDAALRAIARALHASVRDGDALGRLGGEEFGVFVESADLADAAAVAERMRSATEAIALRTDAGIPLRLTVSVGAARWQADARLSEVLREADQRLYEAKRRGRNRVVLPPDAAIAA
ncbi:GGDEF domain-containing protein [Aquibium sp. A9E412]|uniref:GGDEF domain-containing protein n=1 Tax=Aquibium sp. A9E412 TaxID=2976767 RepID=UPI0025B0BC52|nr:GGDEF domain-containing protein [Aquibium sp. A9E412]MDN2566277.1 GGDEF domain-containing protein [Aquibium sp. A9E412]